MLEEFCVIIIDEDIEVAYWEHPEGDGYYVDRRVPQRVRVKESPDRNKVVDLKGAQDDDERDAVEHPLGVHVLLFVYLRRGPRKPDERHQHSEHRPVWI